MTSSLPEISSKGKLTPSVLGISTLLFNSRGKLTAGNALIRLPGMARIDIHPHLTGSKRQADFKATASVFIEVAVVGADPRSDRTDHHRSYRARLTEKLATCQRLKLGAPVIIWADELQQPALGRRMDEVLARLGLPSALAAGGGLA